MGASREAMDTDEEGAEGVVAGSCVGRWVEIDVFPGIGVRWLGRSRCRNGV